LLHGPPAGRNQPYTISRIWKYGLHQSTIPSRPSGSPVGFIVGGLSGGSVPLALPGLEFSRRVRTSMCPRDFDKDRIASLQKSVQPRLGDSDPQAVPHFRYLRLWIASRHGTCRYIGYTQGGTVEAWRLRPSHLLGLTSESHSSPERYIPKLSAASRRLLCSRGQYAQFEQLS